MDKVTRRGFFKQASVSVATTGMLAASPVLMGAAEAPKVQAAEVERSTTTALSEPVVAYVRDFASGEVSILYGTQEIVFHDTELVAHLLRAAR